MTIANIWGGGNISDFKLFREITNLSKSDVWETAKLEWVWIDTYYIDEVEDLESCLCGHLIRECCVIQNKHNGKEAIVGNCCINKFLKTESSLIFQCIKRLQLDLSNSLNPATLEYAYRKCAINAVEYSFYKDKWRKSNTSLSPKQFRWKLRINEAVLKRFRRATDSPVKSS